MAQQKRPTRSKKETINEAPHVNRKANNWTESFGIHKFKLTESQQELARKIENNTLTFVDSVAGTGKSVTVLHTFVREYLKDNTKQLIVVRTAAEVGFDKIGALPDDYKSKTAPHFESTKKLLEQLLSRGKVETDLEHRIHFLIPNFMLGATYDNALIMVDEAQQLSPTILKLVLERIGVNSKCVVVGSSSQLYTDNNHKRDGLKDAIKRFFDKDENPLYDSVATHRFSVNDIMRSDIVKTVITAYEGDGI